MQRHIESAIFSSPVDAGRAMDALNNAGVDRRHISVLQRGDEADEHGRHHDTRRADNKGSGTVKGIGIGAGVGAIAGLTALAIPGVGPFLALGGVAEALGVVGSAAATSAVVGGAAGGLTGALMHYGISEKDAGYYDKRIREGGVWVGVDVSETTMDSLTVRRLLHDYGGETGDVRREQVHDRRERV